MWAKSWRTFVGLQSRAVVAGFEKILAENQYVYELLTREPIFREWFLYGAAQKTTIIRVLWPAFIGITICDVTADPMIRIVYPLVTSKENYKAVTSNISRLEISPIDGHTRVLIGDLIKAFASKLPQNPWDPLKVHPRFRAAPLLFMAVKRSWEKWIKEAA